MDQERLRYADDAFDPFYFRAGEPRGDGYYQVESSWYLERDFPGSEASEIRFEWRGASFLSAIPETDADIVYLDAFFPEAFAGEDVLTIVLVRKSGWRRSLSDAIAGRAPVVEEYEVDVRPT